MGEINKNNTMEIHKPNLVWDDMQLSSIGVRNVSGGPTDTAYTTLRDASDHFLVASFSSIETNTLYFNTQIPHSYYEKSYIRGGYIYPHIHVLYSDANSGDSMWFFSYQVVNVNEVLPTARSEQLVFAAPAVAHKHVVHSFSPINIATLMADGEEEKRISAFLLCRLSRLGADATDTYGTNIHLIGLDFHIQKDTQGSVGHYKKYREI